MKVGSLIDTIRSVYIKQHGEKIVQSSYNRVDKLQHLSDLEAQLTFTLLEKILVQLEKSGLDREATADDVKLILDLMHDRWKERIMNTDVIYPIAIRNPANVLLSGIAKFIAAQPVFLPEGYIEENHLALLMTTVKYWREFRSQINIWKLYPHCYLPSDDNSFLICVENVRGEWDAKIDKLRLYVRLQDSERELSVDEAQRLHDHSLVMSKYYDKHIELNKKQIALNTEKKRGADTSVLSMKEKQIERMRQDELLLRSEMVIACRDQDFSKQKVTTSYGEKGLRLLEDNLYKYINDLFRTREQLFEYMNERVPRNEWNAFLNRFDMKVLQQLMSPKSLTVDDVVNDSTLFSTDNITKYGRIVCYCATKIYWCDRVKQPHYTSYTGNLFGSDKDDKGRAAQILLNALETQEKIDVESLPPNNSEPNVAFAMTRHTLGAIYKRMCEVFKAQPVLSLGQVL